MEICNKAIKQHTFIAGHIYKGWSGTIYLATGIENEKYSLIDGRKEMSSFVRGNYTDVTSQYCLMKKEQA